ncbi:MAG: rRNA (guanosine2251-2-O)-methyltransferase [Pyrinomonadaceae bacterium]|jgi:23S rRNA (guanosine2251-2'-O)-methyltransferase|nr:rRNA (guanosine2251-2-O)-methyltransferase [Pyrinomonadaceae bacterium]
MKNFRRHKPKAATPPTTTTTGDGRDRRATRRDETRGDATRTDAGRDNATRTDAQQRDDTRHHGTRRDQPRNQGTRNHDTRNHDARGETRNGEARRVGGDGETRGGRELRAGEARHSETRQSGARQSFESRNERPRVESRDERPRFESRDERPPDESHLYGVLPVLEALRAGNRRIERITIAEGVHEARLRELFELAREFRVTIRRAPRAELQRIAAAGANHQGVVAHVAAVAYADAGELADALAARVGTDAPPLAVVLDGVEDPRNLGAIIRTAECAGVHGLFVPERRAAGLTETVAKAAAGALEYLPVARATNITRLVEEFKARGIWTIGTDAEANIAYTDWDWTQPCALLLGGEGAGLRRLVRERCDALVRIPLRGRIPSLNVSVAAAVVLYEAVRQRTLARPATYEEGRDGDEPLENGERGKG